MTDKLTKIIAEGSFNLGRTAGAADFASFLMDNGADATVVDDLLQMFLKLGEQPHQNHIN